MIAAGLNFAAADNITLSVAGTQLPTNLAALGALGVDTIDLDGAAAADKTIDATAAAAMIAAGLNFAAADNITLSVAGTQLPTNLAALGALGVDQIVYTDIGITLDVTNDDGVNTFSAAAVYEFGNFDSVAGVPPDAAEAAAATMSFEPPSTEVILPDDADDAFGALIRLLSAGAVEEMHLPTGKQFTVEDSLAAVLSEAGMLEILPATRLQLDATGSGQVVDTSLAAMASLGIDQVQLDDQGEARVYVDLGIQSGTATGAELLELFNALDVDHDRATPLFVGATNVALVLDQGAAELIRETAGAIEAIRGLGITEIAVFGAADGFDLSFGPAPIQVKLIGDDEDPFHHLGHLGWKQ
jgi:hypothetical protein